MINYWRAARGALGIVPGLHRPGLRAIFHRTLVVAALIVVFTVAVCVMDVLAAESVCCGSAALNKALQKLTG
ncbi:hypothetical protein H632_c4149p0 [Helicosporidium sp. ATCC 50920]|nr:hypothetical protein H632_c4149p0 [Helicosporidium sp. ATCC 50920]|eukprot:KDD71931.1 hypothetical protein H632_c4149p0 [Helicosporidium sp. ATCC 50920]